jgi:hypothetical protein
MHIRRRARRDRRHIEPLEAGAHVSTTKERAIRRDHVPDLPVRGLRPRRELISRLHEPPALMAHDRQPDAPRRDLPGVVLLGDVPEDGERSPGVRLQLVGEVIGEPLCPRAGAFC